jgi:thioredoxin
MLLGLPGQMSFLMVLRIGHLRALFCALATAAAITSASAADPLFTESVSLNPGTVNHFKPGTDFDSLVVPQSQHTPVIVDFYASWCGPCMRLAPVLDQLAQEFRGRLTFIRVDTGRNFDDPIAARFSVKSIPLLVVITKDQPPGLVSGAIPIAELREILRSYLYEPTVSDAESL